MKTIEPIIRKNVNFLSVKPSGTKNLLPEGGDRFCPGNFVLQLSFWTWDNGRSWKIDEKCFI